MKKLLWLMGGLWLAQCTTAQETFPVNGVADKRAGCFAFTHATIVKDAQTTLKDATLVIRDGRIVSAGGNSNIPADAVIIDCKDKYIYPSFIDIYSDYGTPASAVGARGFGGGTQAQLTSSTKGAYGWNQAIKSETDAYKLFTADDSKAKGLRESGFGAVLTHVKDGIARGTGTFVSLGNEKENLLVIKDKASAHYALSKGSSTQSYPNSMMGIIALLRQTFLDAQWYKTRPAKEGLNLSLQSWNENQALPQIIDAGDKWNDLRADRIGDEFGVQYIIKGGGNEYQRIKEIAGTRATYILGLNFPQTQDVEDPNDARFVSLTDLKHWELAPTNPSVMEKANIPFCLTTAELRDVKQFMTNLRTALNYGLTETAAINALTKTPATVLGLYDQVGSLDAGKWANFLITSGNVFNERTTIFQNWVQGNKFSIKDDTWKDLRGTYKLVLNTSSGPVNYTLDFKSNTAASLIGKDTVTSKFYYDGRQVRINVAPERRGGENLRLSGIVNNNAWTGYGEDSSGNRFSWTATYDQPSVQKADSARKRPLEPLGKVTYPFEPFGWDETQAPKQETLLFKNATVWTSEKEGVLQNTDVLVRNGKIASVGKNLSATGARVIDGTGKHLTAGVIDEHSHIAAGSINEGGQSITSEVRIGDNLNPDDINIYRQLSGGVTTSHILHGSANTIGGQTQLIKLRWGANDEDLKFKGADPFIKFALGENVKRSPSAIGNNSNNNRFPDTRMGVEEVLVDAFTRAHDYENAMKASGKKGSVRRDLELDALVEILNEKRFITCHSYIQSEITAAMRVAEKMGYKYNTFTHILEGYKVADKMKQHGAAASTFSDWWYYKMEVVDAIPYNAWLMQQQGMNVAINSDDAEMARRLNQEAAKSIKYGGMSEENALKMVTINPAKMMHIDSKVGSIKTGKDADLVLWSDNPLSIYAKSLYTVVDGTVYFDREKDIQLRKQVAAERLRIIRRMIGDKRTGAPVQPAQPSYQVVQTCDDHYHSHGLLSIQSGDN
ncbi:amidohydrolase [Segetibacter sp. 3557_3]|uniref:amidohydrolase family protein n=1 Tax=Segetibacter sp. 3557_3 TaxID=2547429 RepID=UPI001058F90C|nr:amidohydrolase family protein [Segetibacter sp. 3557_3]TDH25209.1 amidohydrolase [Segetibacter sp. 3557_3]